MTLQTQYNELNLKAHGYLKITMAGLQDKASSNQ